MASLGRMSALRFKRFNWVILKTFPKLVIVWYSALRRRARVSITTVSIIWLLVGSLQCLHYDTAVVEHCKRTSVPTFKFRHDHSMTERLLTVSLKIQIKKTWWTVEYSMYSWNSVAQTALGPWQFAQNRGCSSHWGLIIAPGQEAKWR